MSDSWRYPFFFLRKKSELHILPHGACYLCGGTEGMQSDIFVFVFNNQFYCSLDLCLLTQVINGGILLRGQRSEVTGQHGHAGEDGCLWQIGLLEET